MIDKDRASAQLPANAVATLIRTALHAKDAGQPAAARAVLQALLLQQPHEPRIWLALAAVADTRDEQRHALEQALALDPENMPARRGLERFAALAGASPPPLVRQTAAHVEPVEPDAQSSAARTQATQPPTSRPFFFPRALPDWLVPAAGVAVVALLTLALLPRIPNDPPTLQAPAATLSGVAAPSPPAAAAVAMPSVTIAPPRQPTALPTLAPLAPGHVIERGPWRVTLLRPEHAVLLDSGIDTIKPRGRLVIALVTISNSGPAAARAPANLFALVDTAGRRYLPLAGASTAYLNSYGRGIHGDLSLDDAIPQGGGFVSVPLIFDTPADARGLTLHVGDLPTGWAIGGR